RTRPVTAWRSMHTRRCGTGSLVSTPISGFRAFPQPDGRLQIPESRTSGTVGSAAIQLSVPVLAPGIWNLCHLETGILLPRVYPITLATASRALIIRGLSCIFAPGRLYMAAAVRGERHFGSDTAIASSQMAAPYL